MDLSRIVSVAAFGVSLGSLLVSWISFRVNRPNIGVTYRVESGESLDMLNLLIRVTNRGSQPITIMRFRLEERHRTARGHFMGTYTVNEDLLMQESAKIRVGESTESLLLTYLCNSRLMTLVEKLGESLSSNSVTFGSEIPKIPLGLPLRLQGHDVHEWAVPFELQSAQAQWLLYYRPTLTIELGGDRYKNVRNRKVGGRWPGENEIQWWPPSIGIPGDIMEDVEDEVGGDSEVNTDVAAPNDLRPPAS
jgi:hypothetical protein